LRPLAQTDSQCMMKPVSNPPFLNPQTTLVEDKHLKVATHRVMLMHQELPIVHHLLEVWVPHKKMLLLVRPMHGVGYLQVLSGPQGQDQCITAIWAQGAFLRPPTMIQVIVQSKPKLRICSGSMRSTMTPQEEPGWTNFFHSWRIEEPQSHSVRPSLKTH